MYLIIQGTNIWREFTLTAELYREAKSGLITIVNLNTQKIYDDAKWASIPLRKR